MSTMSEEYIREAKEDYDRIVRSVLFGPDGCKIYIENDYMCEGCSFGNPADETCTLYEKLRR